MIEKLSRQHTGILYACITALLWGFLAIALKVAVATIDAITISWFRFFIAALIMIIFMMTSKKEQLSSITRFPLLKGGVRAIGLMGVAAIGLSFNYMGYIYGLQLTSAINTQIVVQSAPLLLGVVGILFFKEKVSVAQGIGFVIAVTGFYFFYANKLSSSLINTTSDTYTKGTIYVVLSGLCWVVYAVCQKLLVSKHSVQLINCFIFSFASLILLPFIDVSVILNLSIGMWLLMLFLGLNTLAAYSALGMAFRLADANKVGMIITLNPLITILSMSVLSILQVSWVSAEVLTMNSLIAAIAVVVGAIIAVTAK